MKKKIKDLTLEEVMNYCRNKKDCDECCLYSIYKMCSIGQLETETNEFYEQEIEVEDDVD